MELCAHQTQNARHDSPTVGKGRKNDPKKGREPTRQKPGWIQKKAFLGSCSYLEGQSLLSHLCQPVTHRRTPLFLPEGYGMQSKGSLVLTGQFEPRALGGGRDDHPSCLTVVFGDGDSSFVFETGGQPHHLVTP